MTILLETVIKLLKDGNGWIRSAVVLAVLVFMSGMIYQNFKNKVEALEIRVSKTEKISDDIQLIKESVARIEGELGVNRRKWR